MRISWTEPALQDAEEIRAFMITWWQAPGVLFEFCALSTAKG